MSMNRPLATGRALTALVLTGLLVSLGLSPSLAKATLRWKFKEGDVLRYSMDQTTVLTGQDPQGNEVKQTIGLIMDMTWTVKSVDPSGTATISQRIDRVRTSAEMPFGKFSFDSKEAGDASSVAGPLFKMLVNAEFTSKMSPLGALTDIKLSEKLLANFRGDNEPLGAQGQFSEEGLKNMLVQMVLPLPEQSVDAGQTWPRKMTIPAGPKGETRQIDQTFTYKGVDASSGGLGLIEFSTKFEPPKADPNVPVTLKSETATGRFDFDADTGRVVKSNVAENAEMKISIQGKEIPQKVTTTRVLTLSKDKAP